MFPYSPSSLAARALPRQEIPAPRHEKCEICGLIGFSKGFFAGWMRFSHPGRSPHGCSEQPQSCGCGRCGEDCHAFAALLLPRQKCRGSKPDPTRFHEEPLMMIRVHQWFDFPFKDKSFPRPGFPVRGIFSMSGRCGVTFARRLTQPPYSSHHGHGL
jgi:hypothetical protein